MKYIVKVGFFCALAVIFFSSCRMLRPEIMLRTPGGYQFAELADSMSKIPHKVGVADLLNISISPNDGFNKVNFTLENNNRQIDFFEVIVDLEGKIKLPLIGRIDARGKTIRQLEDEIESLYSNYYVSPFVNIKVMNRRVIVFQGSGGRGRSIPITDYNTTLFEALAQAGGILEDGKAYRIKLVRTLNGVTKVYLVDLSNIKNVAQGNTIVMSNDIIYVEPRFKFTQKFVSELTPYLTLLSTTLILVTLLKK
jgi:polysaccharide biosynthesis/export protein